MKIQAASFILYPPLGKDDEDIPAPFKVPPPVTVVLPRP
jgi:hypothetical protein